MLPPALRMAAKRRGILKIRFRISSYGITFHSSLRAVSRSLRDWTGGWRAQIQQPSVFHTCLMGFASSLPTCRRLAVLWLQPNCRPVSWVLTPCSISITISAARSCEIDIFHCLTWFNRHSKEVWTLFACIRLITQSVDTVFHTVRRSIGVWYTALRIAAHNRILHLFLLHLAILSLSHLSSILALSHSFHISSVVATSFVRFPLVLRE